MGHLSSLDSGNEVFLGGDIRRLLNILILGGKHYQMHSKLRHNSCIYAIAHIYLNDNCQILNMKHNLCPFLHIFTHDGLYFDMPTLSCIKL